MVARSGAIDDREFPVVLRGYDREQVKAYLSEIEASFRELERWAEEAKARLKIAEEKNRRLYDVDEAMVAVFAAKDRVIERGRLQAERVEAEARERARLEYEDAAAGIIAEAEEKARRIIGALVTSERLQYESILGDARAEADRIIEEARAKADRVVAQSQAAVANSQDVAEDSLVVDLTEPGNGDEDQGEGALRRTRYQRRSATLPSIGDDASQVIKSLESLRENPSTD